MQAKPILGVIGGSGLYALDGIANGEFHDLDTPFGKPSSPLFVGERGGKRVVFLARHGIGHVYAPAEVNYRANIYAMKMLGVDRIVAVSACGSLREDYAPGDIVIPDQLFDRTENRQRSFLQNSKAMLGDTLGNVSYPLDVFDNFQRPIEKSLFTFNG